MGCPSQRRVMSRGMVEMSASYWMLCPFANVATLASLSRLTIS